MGKKEEKDIFNSIKKIRPLKAKHVRYLIDDVIKGPLDVKKFTDSLEPRAINYMTLGAVIAELTVKKESDLFELYTSRGAVAFGEELAKRLREINQVEIISDGILSMLFPVNQSEFRLDFGDSPLILKLNLKTLLPSFLESEIFVYVNGWYVLFFTKEANYNASLWSTQLNQAVFSKIGLALKPLTHTWMIPYYFTLNWHDYPYDPLVFCNPQNFFCSYKKEANFFKAIFMDEDHLDEFTWRMTGELSNFLKHYYFAVRQYKELDSYYIHILKITKEILGLNKKGILQKIYFMFKAKETDLLLESNEHYYVYLENLDQYKDLFKKTRNIAYASLERELADALLEKIQPRKRNYNELKFGIETSIKLLQMRRERMWQILLPLIIGGIGAIVSLYLWSFLLASLQALLATISNLITRLF